MRPTRPMHAEGQVVAMTPEQWARATAEADRLLATTPQEWAATGQEPEALVRGQNWARWLLNFVRGAMA